MSSSLFAIALSSQTIVMLLILGVLLFGRRLPEIGMSLGKSITEFKRGLGGFEDDITQAILQPRTARPPAPRPPEQLAAPQPCAGTSEAVAAASPPLGI